MWHECVNFKRLHRREQFAPSLCLRNRGYRIHYGGKQKLHYNGFFRFWLHDFEVGVILQIAWQYFFYFYFFLSTTIYFSSVWLTYAEREGVVPRPPLAPQAGEHLWTLEGVARVTAVWHSAPSKVTLVFPLVAKLGDAWILTFNQLKTLRWERKKERERSQIRRFLKKKD